MNKKTYVIIDIDMVTEDILEKSISDEKNHRISLDKKFIILKFKIKHPNSLSGIKKYEHAEVLTFLNQNLAQWDRDLPLIPIG